MTPTRRVLALLLFAALPASGAEPGGSHPRPDAETFFEVKIRPVLAGTCLRCHGGEKVNGGLRVDSRHALLKGGDRGPAIVPGAPDRSLLIQALRHADGAEVRMPPGKKLPAGTVADFADWVRRGAPWPVERVRDRDSARQPARHWAFQPVRKVEPPQPGVHAPGSPVPEGWAASPIDRFIAAGLRQHGIVPAGPADRRTLIRRITFDLTGLPPTPDEIATFVADDRPDAYERLVERLLASPAYGERWGRHWMDLVRYADTAGDNADYPVPEAALYRDYIIASFNADKSYDQFVREQLAGDVLARQGPPERYAERVVATTYLALSRRYLTAPYEEWHLTLEDAIDTTGRAFLGLTLRCARCHDHKFDPVTTADYYALYGIFASTRFPFAGSEEFFSMKRPREHFVPVVPPAQAEPRLAVYRRQLDRLRAEIARAEKEDPLTRRQAALAAITDIETKLLQDLQKAHAPAADVKAELARHTAQRDLAKTQLQQKLQPLRDRLVALERAGLPADVPGAYAVSEGTPTDVPVQRGGDPHRPGPIVPRGVPKFLPGDRPFTIAPGSSGRLELARWLTDPSNPLFARVMVNRIWQYHFGKGLVATPSNFGLRSEPPSHPELLDWLAARFVESGWSVKAMHRLIVTSKTYQLASAGGGGVGRPAPRAGSLAADPANRWYGRFERQRLDAEAIRDAMLAVSGRLDRRRAGPQPFPPISEWKWTQHYPFKDVYPTDKRTVYLMTQRLKRHPFLALFDGPDTNTTTDVRGSSTVPLQALFLMNNPFVRQQADGLARRCLAGAADLPGRVSLAYELTWGRPPAPYEIEAVRHYLERYRAELARLALPPSGQEVEAWASLACVLLSANEFVYVD